jgi:hypothetical protein
MNEGGEREEERIKQKHIAAWANLVDMSPVSEMRNR